MGFVVWSLLEHSYENTPCLTGCISQCQSMCAGTMVTGRKYHIIWLLRLMQSTVGTVEQLGQWQWKIRAMAYGGTEMWDVGNWRSKFDCISGKRLSGPPVPEKDTLKKGELLTHISEKIPASEPSTLCPNLSIWVLKSWQGEEWHNSYNCTVSVHKSSCKSFLLLWFVWPYPPLSSGFLWTQ